MYPGIWDKDWELSYLEDSYLRLAQLFHSAATDREPFVVWLMVDIVVPARPGRTAGVRTAGFRGCAEDSIELEVVPYPELTVFIDFGDALFVDDADGARKRGSVVGLAARNVSGYGRDVELPQVRLSPAAAHAALGASAKLGGAVVTTQVT